MASFLTWYYNDYIDHCGEYYDDSDYNDYDDDIDFHNYNGDSNSTHHRAKASLHRKFQNTPIVKCAGSAQNVRRRCECESKNNRCDEWCILPRLHYAGKGG